MIAMQLLLIVVTAVILVITYGLCNIFTVDARIYSSHEHMPIYIDPLSCVIAKIRFLVLAVPIVMLGEFAVANLAAQYSQIVMINYVRTTLKATLIAAIIGMIAQAIFVAIDEKNDPSNHLKI